MDHADVSGPCWTTKHFHLGSQVLINNAGIYGRRLALEEFEPEDFISTFTTNAVTHADMKPPQAVAIKTVRS